MIEKMTAQFLDDRFGLTDEQLAGLVGELRENKAAAADFKEQLLLDELLSRHLACDRRDFCAQVRQRIRQNDSGTTFFRSVTDRIKETEGRRQDVRREMVRNRAGQARPIRWGRWISIAACLAIIVGSLMYNARQEEQFVEVLVAHIQQTEPNVKVIRGADGRVVAAIVSMELFPGDRIETKKGEKVVFGYPGEETSVTVGDGKRESALIIGTVEKGKRLRLEKGIIDASVAPQSADRHMVIETPHAEAKVIGTVFTLRVDQKATWLDVKEGFVELMRLDDGKVARVGAGLLAVAGANAADYALKAYAAGTEWVDGAVIFEDDFEDGWDLWDVGVAVVGASDDEKKTLREAARKLTSVIAAKRNGMKTSVLCQQPLTFSGKVVVSHLFLEGKRIEQSYVMEYDVYMRSRKKGRFVASGGVHVASGRWMKFRDERVLFVGSNGTRQWKRTCSFDDKSLLPQVLDFEEGAEPSLWAARSQVEMHIDIDNVEVRALVRIGNEKERYIEE